MDTGVVLASGVSGLVETGAPDTAVGALGTVFSSGVEPAGVEPAGIEPEGVAASGAVAVIWPPLVTFSPDPSLVTMGRGIV